MDRANDGMDNRGQGHVPQGESIVLSFNTSNLIHVLQDQQACHLLPCLPGPLFNPSSCLQEVGNSGLSYLDSKCPVRLHKDLGGQKDAFFDILHLLFELLAELVDRNASLTRMGPSEGPWHGMARQHDNPDAAAHLGFLEGPSGPD